MRIAVTVKGGTGAGVKDPIAARREPWVCSNGHPNQGWIVRCLATGCNEKRP